MNLKEGYNDDIQEEAGEGSVLGDWCMSSHGLSLNFSVNKWFIMGKRLN